MSDLYVSAYNPDVLSCIANLSNDEVFTPPEVANAMLDLLPQELFRSRKLEEQQELINLYVEKIIVHPDQVEVILNLISLSLQEDYARDTSYISRGKLKKEYRRLAHKKKR